MGGYIFAYKWFWDKSQAFSWSSITNSRVHDLAS